MRSDLNTWLIFLEHPTAFARPFADFSTETTSEEIDFYSDASGKLGYGAICAEKWMHGLWSHRFITEMKPSIEYLELYALVAAVVAWLHLFKNRKITVFIDNKSICDMINATSSSCKNCMVLIKILVLKCLVENVVLKAKYVKSSDNKFADALSRDQIDWFKANREKWEESPTLIPEQLTPITKIWRW